MSIPISSRVSRIPPSAIHEMTRLSRQVKDVAFLSWAKPTTGTPEHINRAAVAAIESGRTGGYSSPAGLDSLREAVCAKLISFNGIKADPEEIIITVGAIEGLAAAVLAVVDPGDEVMIPVPGYSTHVRQVELASARPVCVPTRENKGFRLDLDHMAAAVTPRTRAILYSDPNNPTGSVYSREELESLSELARRHNLVVITDEAYEYFTFDGHRHHSIASLPGMAERTISVFTFTKTYAMTGWRIGYLHAPRELAAQIKKAHIPLAICAPVVSQFAALEALTGSQDCIRDFHAHYRNARDLMCRRLDALADVFDYQTPRGSYLMFPRLKNAEHADSLDVARRLLLESRVSTTPGIAFQGESHLRLSFCVPEEMIDKAFDRMEEFFT